MNTQKLKQFKAKNPERIDGVSRCVSLGFSVIFPNLQRNSTQNGDLLNLFFKEA